MRIYPAPHYTMGGLWVDYHLMSTLPGLFVLGEANFSEHGANRLGASALMQGLADGYFIAPGHGHRLAGGAARRRPAGRPSRLPRRRWRRSRRGSRRCGRRGVTSPWTSSIGELGRLMIEACGISRRGERLQAALDEVEALRRRFLRRGAHPRPGRWPRG